MTNSDAQRDRVLHVVIGRTSLRRTLNVLKTYAQHAAKKVTITRIAPPVNKSMSATGHSARECPSNTVSICNSCGDAAHQQHSYPSYAQRQLSLPTFHQRQRYPRSQSRQVVRQVLRRRNHRRPHLPHAVTVDSIGHAFGVDNHDHHHRVRNFDSYSNSGQESATHVDRPRLIRGQLSCFLLKCDIRLHSIAHCFHGWN